MNSTINTETSLSWASMEGVPDWVELPVDKSAPPKPAATTNVAHRALEWAGQVLAGVAFAAGLAWLAEFLARWFGTNMLGYAKSPISGVPVAILLGLAICNTVGLPATFRAGLRVCATTLLRLAIVLLGLRLSLGAAAGIGWRALPVVALCVGGALLVVPWLGEKAGLPRRLAALIAVGTGICGVTAIIATAPAIKAEDDEISYAVACVAIFGMTAMIIHPVIAHFLFATDVRAAGIFLGTAIHDTSQVAGAALTYASRYQMPEALNVATVTKLMRNLCLAGAIPFIVWRYARGAAASTTDKRPAWHTVFPIFVLGFLAMTIIRTVGDSSARPFGLLEMTQWKNILGVADNFAGMSITIVMAAIGLQTDFSKFKRLGLRPFLIGLVAACGVGLLSVGTLLATRGLFGS